MSNELKEQDLKEKAKADNIQEQDTNKAKKQSESKTKDQDENNLKGQDNTKEQDTNNSKEQNSTTEQDEKRLKEQKALLRGKLARIIQGYKSYEFWKTKADNCGKTIYVLTDDILSKGIFDLESFAFALHTNEPFKIHSYNNFDDVEDFEKPGTLRFITKDYFIENLLYLKEENAPLFKPYLNTKDLKHIQELLQNPLVSENEKIVSLAYLCQISTTKHNAFLLSIHKQESFYKKMQVFEQAKAIFTLYEEARIDLLKVFIFAFYPNSSYEFSAYLVKKFEKELLSSTFVNFNQSIDSFKDIDRFKDLEFIQTPFKLIDICLVQAFFSARLDLMLLLEQYGANYEIFNTLFSLEIKEFNEYQLYHISVMTNLVQYNHENALAYLLDKGVRHQRFFEIVLKGANKFAQKLPLLASEKHHKAIRFFIKNQDNEEFDDQFRLYAKKIAFIEHTNAKAIRGTQIINQSLRGFIDKESKFYAFTDPKYNDLLTPLATEQYDLLPQSWERILLYCIEHFPQFYSKKADPKAVLQRLPEYKNKWRLNGSASELIKNAVEYDKDINYEF